MAHLGGFPWQRPTEISFVDDPKSRQETNWAALKPEERACCCLAPPAVRAVFVHTDPAVHSVDLLMCGHHYRRSAAKLAELGAMVFDREGNLLPSDFVAVAAAMPVQKTADQDGVDR